MKFKRISALILSVIMLFAAAGCGGKTANKGEILTAINPNNTNRFYYSVIYPSDSSDEVESAAKKIRTELKAAFDVYVEANKDEKVEADSNNPEILIGNTDRQETAEALEILKANRGNYYLDFIIKVINNKIVIFAENDSMLVKAIEYFIDTYCKSKEAWEKLNTSTELIYEAPIKEKAHQIAGVPLEKFVIVTPRDCEYIYSREIYKTVDYLYGNQGYMLSVVDERTEPAKNEILVGNLERAESKSVEVSGENAWIIKAVNGKLVIKATDSLSLGAAVEELYNIIEDEEAKNSYLNLQSDYELKGTYEPSDSDYVYTWGDEFNGSSLDKNTWGDYINEPYGMTATSVLGGSTVTKSVENVKLTGDGTVTIFATRNGNDFENGQISTFDRMQYLYGILEIRGKLPVAPGCASYWMNGAEIGYGSMTEYDLLENFGSVNSFAANIHIWSGNGYHNSLDFISSYKKAKEFKFNDALAPNEDLSSDYHIYTMAWDESRVDFAFDGRVFFSYSLEDTEESDVHRLPVYFLTGCSAGGADYGVAATKDSPTYYEHKIDYIRLYQRKDIGKLYLGDQIPKYDGREYYRYFAGQKTN